MRLLFFIAVALFVVWAVKRLGAGRATTARNDSPTRPQDMVACLHCGVHLPRDEAVSGTLGPYCSTAHRSAAGDRNPG